MARAKRAIRRVGKKAVRKSVRKTVRKAAARKHSKAKRSPAASSSSQKSAKIFSSSKPLAFKNANPKMNKVLNEALSQVMPDRNAAFEEVNRTILSINSELKRRRIAAVASAGGSIAKDTFLKDDYDCDVFAKFSYKYSDRSTGLSDILEPALRKVFGKVDRLHGSRDYFQARNTSSNLKFEIVPVLDISKPSQAKNITDCSPLHVKWANKFKDLKPEIMLAKAFAKSAGVYGAESYKKGFSGHVIDIITIYYRGFIPLLKASAKWKCGQVIDYNNAHKGKALFNLNKSKTQSALIVIDPIASERNASAALGSQPFENFIKKAKEFLASPSLGYFRAPEFSLEEVRLEAGRHLVLAFDVVPEEGKEDVIGAKLLKAEEFLARSFEDKDSILIKHGWQWPQKKNALFWYVLDEMPLAKTKTVNGPPAAMQKHAENFTRLHNKVSVVGERLVALVEREFTKPQELADKMIKDQYITERVKGIALKA